MTPVTPPDLPPESPPENPHLFDALSFEEAFKRLEVAVHRLEDDALTLDDALRAYEEGAVLADHCAALLETARLRLVRLTPSGSETPLD